MTINGAKEQPKFDKTKAPIKELLTDLIASVMDMTMCKMAIEGGNLIGNNGDNLPRREQVNKQVAQEICDEIVRRCEAKVEK